jgi:hypothetical protein
MELDSVLLVVSGVHHRTDEQSGPEYIAISDYPTFLKSLIFFSTAIMSSDGALHTTFASRRRYNRIVPSAIHGHSTGIYTHMHSGGARLRW